MIIDIYVRTIEHDLWLRKRFWCFWNKFINISCDFAWIFRISRLCFQKSVPHVSLHFRSLFYFLTVLKICFNFMAKNGEKAYLAREQSRFFRPGGGALGARDDEKSQSSDDVEDVDADGRGCMPTGHVLRICLMLLHYYLFIQKLPALIGAYWEGSWIHVKIPEESTICSTLLGGWFLNWFNPNSLLLRCKLVSSPIYRSSNLERWISSGKVDRGFQFSRLFHTGSCFCGRR